MLPPEQSEQFRVAEETLSNKVQEFEFVSLNQLPKDLLMLLVAQAFDLETTTKRSALVRIHSQKNGKYLAASCNQIAAGRNFEDMST